MKDTWQVTFKSNIMNTYFKGTIPEVLFIDLVCFVQYQLCVYLLCNM